MLVRFDERSARAGTSHGGSALAGPSGPGDESLQRQQLRTKVGHAPNKGKPRQRCSLRASWMRGAPLDGMALRALGVGPSGHDLWRAHPGKAQRSWGRSTGSSMWSVDDGGATQTCALLYITDAGTVVQAKDGLNTRSTDAFLNKTVFCGVMLGEMGIER